MADAGATHGALAGHSSHCLDGLFSEISTGDGQNERHTLYVSIADCRAAPSAIVPVRTSRRNAQDPLFCRPEMIPAAEPQGAHQHEKWRADSKRRAPESMCTEAFALSDIWLAARRCVGHIGLTGDVAEWLKAAVC